MKKMRLRSTDFHREREKQWLELDAIVKRAERRGLKALNMNELYRLPALYRAAVSSLSVARAISLDRNLLRYLESLVARAYFCVYGVKPQAWGVVRKFFLKKFPATVQRFRSSILLAVAMLFFGIIAGLVSTDPETYLAVMPESMAQERLPTTSTEELRSVLYSEERPGTELGFFTTYLFTHNARIGFLSFALGFALGLPAILLLFYNGLLLGLMAGLYGSRGLGIEFWAWVLPHGVTELLAVILCGGAGMAVGMAILRPGRYGRMNNLARTGRRASLLVLGAVLMFLMAGLLEGFFRQLVHNLLIRYGVATITLVFWFLYLNPLRKVKEEQ